MEDMQAMGPPPALILPPPPSFWCGFRLLSGAYHTLSLRVTLPSLSFWEQRPTAKCQAFSIKSASTADSVILNMPPIVLTFNHLPRDLCPQKDKDQWLSDWVSV